MSVRDPHQPVLPRRIWGLVFEPYAVVFPLDKQPHELVRRHDLEFDNLLAEPETLMLYYRVLTGNRWIGTPTFLVFDPRGELLARQVGAVEVEIVENFIAANSAED